MCVCVCVCEERGRDVKIMKRTFVWRDYVKWKESMAGLRGERVEWIVMCE